MSWANALGEVTGPMLYEDRCGSFRTLGVPHFGGPYYKDPTISTRTLAQRQHGFMRSRCYRYYRDIPAEGASGSYDR